jgi:glycosyltransferase involved in cell wall biosynthesis
MHGEEASLPTFFGRLLPALEATGESFEIVCVNDGSQDATLARLRNFQKQEPRL